MKTISDGENKIASPSKLMNRNFLLVLVSNSVLASPMPMLIILSGLAGGMLAPTKQLSTLPYSLQLLAGFIAAPPMSLFMARYGRGRGFLLAIGLTMTGGGLALVAMKTGEFWLLCLGHAFLGSAVISFGYFRFAATEVVSERWRATAISFTLGSGIIAAIVGPAIFSRTREILAPTLFAGSYLAIMALALIGMIPVLLTRYPAPAGFGAQRRWNKDAAIILRRPRVFVAIFSATAVNAIMILLMTPTALEMVMCGFSETQASRVISWHVVAMFAPGLFTGYLVARFGSSFIIMIGAVFLIAASVVAAADVTLANFFYALLLLGVGWNFGFIGASSMLNESLSATERLLVQGANDTIVALAATLASLGAGILISIFGWISLSYTAFPIIFLLLLSLLWLQISTGRRLRVVDLEVVKTANDTREKTRIKR
jgi:MFS family permease